MGQDEISRVGPYFWELCLHVLSGNFNLGHTAKFPRNEHLVEPVVHCVSNINSTSVTAYIMYHALPAVVHRTLIRAGTWKLCLMCL